MYYAAHNSHSSPISYGFVNAWNVAVFDTREHRDAWVEQAQDIATRAIRREAVIDFASRFGNRRPLPFRREAWGIVEPMEVLGEGHIGDVEIADLTLGKYDHPRLVRRVYASK
jgi:hypothetical protein